MVEIPEARGDYPALGWGSRGGVWRRSVVDGAEVAADGVGDVLVSGVLVGPAALLGIVAQLDDVGELGSEYVSPGGVGDVVVALLADVGVALSVRVG